MAEEGAEAGSDASGLGEPHGPPFLVLVVTDARSRWQREDGQAASLAMERSVRAGLASVREDRGGEEALASLFVAGEGDDANHCLGIALVSGWSVASGEQRSAQARAMMRSLQDTHRRSAHVNFLCHRFFKAARLVPPCALGSGPWFRRGSGEAVPPFAATGAFREAGSAPASRPEGFEEVVGRWERQCGHCAGAQLHIWPTWAPLGHAIAHGVWGVDVFAVVARASGAKRSWCPPFGPSVREARRLKASLVGVRLGSPCPARALSAGSVGQRRRTYEPATVVAAVAATRSCSDQAKARAALAASVSLLAPVVLGLRRELAAAQFSLPTQWTLRRRRVQLDIAAMVAHRAWFEMAGRTYRYVCCDASPQMHQSVEVFASAERVVPRAAVAGRTAAQVDSDAICFRLLPLTTLGQGHTDLRNKAEALLHQTWLDYGPLAGSVRSAAADVRQVLSDMGTEAGIADSADIVDQVLVGAAPVPPQEREHMYPLALQVPGVLHIVDWLIRESAESFPWWPRWLERCKRILQHLHGRNHRGRLCAFIERTCADAENRQHLVGLLARGTGRFAQWRWRPLERALDDLERVLPALEFCFTRFDIAQRALAIRDGPASDALAEAVLDTGFWDQTFALQFVLRRVMPFMGWVQGCPCHEAGLLAGKRVVCQLKGMRAPALAQAVAELTADLSKGRDSILPGAFGSVSEGEVCGALTKCMAFVALKFA